MKNLILYLKEIFKTHKFSLKEFDQSISLQEDSIHYELKEGDLFLYPAPNKFIIVKNILIPPCKNIDVLDISVLTEDFDIFPCDGTYFKISKSNT